MPIPVPSPAPEPADLSAVLSTLADAIAALAAALAGTAPPAVPRSRPAPLPSLAPPLVECVNQFLLSKARAGRSERYLRQLRVSLRSLLAGRARTPVDQVAAVDLERWLAAHGWAPRTRRGYLADASTLFAWCIRRGFLPDNPAAAVELPRAAGRPPGIHTPAEARAALEHALARDAGAARLLAVRYFAGVRTAEALRLVETDLAGGWVRVEASKSKTRRRRLVRLEPALAAWLALPGELPVSEKRMRAALAGVPVPWPANVTRHSWVSYRLAATGNAAGTALEAGHAEAVMFAHYRELATPEAAAAFWSIRPPGQPNGTKPEPLSK